MMPTWTVPLFPPRHDTITYLTSVLIQGTFPSLSFGHEVDWSSLDQARTPHVLILPARASTEKGNQMWLMMRITTGEAVRPTDTCGGAHGGG